MNNSESITKKTKTSKDAYAKGETVATTLRIPVYLRTSWFNEVGKRLISSELGTGWKQVPSAQQIVVEDLAKGIGVELAKEPLKKNSGESSEVIRYMLNLPKVIHDKINELANARNKSFNTTALELLTDAYQHRNETVDIQINLQQPIFEKYKSEAYAKGMSIEDYVKSLLI
jgi:hypothetical protein